MDKTKQITLGGVVSQVKSLNDSEDSPLIITGYANVAVEDRAGDLIPAGTWKKASALTNYLKNPIILFNHDRDDPIGKMIDHQITDLGLEVTVEISKGAGKVYDLIKDGILKAFSVGFRLLDLEYSDAANQFIITELELTEISVVSIPCNQDSTFSLAKAMNGGDYLDIYKEFVKEKKPEQEPQSLIQKLLATGSAPVVELSAETRTTLLKIISGDKT